MDGTLLGALIGGCAAVLGGMVAPVIIGRQEHRRWLRSQLAVSCRTQAALLERAHQALIDRDHSGRTVEIRTPHAELDAICDALLKASDELAIFSPIRLRHASQLTYVTFARTTVVHDPEKCVEAYNGFISKQ